MLAKVLLFLVATSLSVGYSSQLLAKPGDIDRGFGLNGELALLPENNASAPHLLALGGGKYYAITSKRGFFSSNHWIARMDESGAMDAAFGSNGIAEAPEASFADFRGVGAALKYDDDAVLVLGGCQSGNHTCVSRFSANGTYDSQLASVRPYLDIPAEVTVFAIRSIEKVGSGYLAGGLCRLNADASAATLAGSLRGCFVRYLTDLSLDASWGSGGVIASDFYWPSQYMTTVFRVDASGQPYFAYPCEGFCVVRWLSNGERDQTWGVSGTARSANQPALTTAYPHEAGPADLLFLGDGRVVLVGGCEGGANGTLPSKFCITRLLSNGVVDPAYGNGTIFQVNAGLADLPWGRARRVFSTPDGGVLIIGYCSNTSSSDGIQPFVVRVCAVRLSSTGELDSRFGVSGATRVGLQNNQVTDALVDGVGRALVLGACINGSACLARLFGQQDYFDLDGDNLTQPSSDAVLYLRHLLGFHDTALTSGALGTYADRTSATDIATYLSTPNPSYPNCSASIVGAPGGPQAMLDGIVLLRAMMGLTGEAVTNGIAFPAGTARTAWVDIKAHLNGNCGMALN